MSKKVLDDELMDNVNGGISELSAKANIIVNQMNDLSQKADLQQKTNVLAQSNDLLQKVDALNQLTVGQKTDMLTQKVDSIKKKTNMLDSLTVRKNNILDR